MFSFVFLISLLSHITSVYSSHDSILEVTMACGATPDVPSTVSVISDVPVYVTGDCANGEQHFTTLNNVLYTLDVYTTTTDPTKCVLPSTAGVNTYTLHVIVGFGDSHTGIQAQAEQYLLTCVYDNAGTNVGEDTERTVVNSVQAPEEILQHMRPTSVATFNLYLVDVLGNKIEGDIQLGRKARLDATIAGDDNEVGLQTTSCLAVGEGVAYPILIGGCGDGIIIPLDEGFVSNGLKVESPYFAVFSLLGSNQLKFRCNFTACYNTSCDGDSCTTTARRRRALDTSLWDSLDFQQKAIDAGDYLDDEDPADDYSHIQLESIHSNVVSETCLKSANRAATERQKRAAIYTRQLQKDGLYESILMVLYGSFVVLFAAAVAILCRSKRKNLQNEALARHQSMAAMIQQITPIPVNIRRQYEAKQCR